MFLGQTQALKRLDSRVEVIKFLSETKLHAKKTTKVAPGRAPPAQCVLKFSKPTSYFDHVLRYWAIDPLFVVLVTGL